MEINRESETWDEWKREHRDPQTARSWLAGHSAETRAQFSAREKFFCYVQWIADQQWREVKICGGAWGGAHGRHSVRRQLLQRGCFLERDVFHLDWSGGAPPEPYFKDDEFTQKWGQNWGIPVYRWEAMGARISPGGDNGCAA